MPSPLARAVATGVLLLFWTAAPALAQDRGNPDWYVRLATYLWLSNLDGSNTVAGLSVPVTDTVLEPSWSVRAEVGKGRVRAIFDLSRTSLTNPVAQAPPSTVQGTYDFTVFVGEVAGAVQVGGFGTDRAVEVFGGMRYVRQQQTLDVSGTITIAGEFTEDWLEPFFGSRYFTELGRRFWFTMTADVGGLNIGSDFTWVLDGELGIRVARPVDFTLRYRYMESQYSNDRLGDQAYVWDEGQLQGWYFGLVIKR